MISSTQAQPSETGLKDLGKSPSKIKEIIKIHFVQYMNGRINQRNRKASLLILTANFNKLDKLTLTIKEFRKTNFFLNSKIIALNMIKIKNHVANRYGSTEDMTFNLDKVCLLRSIVVKFNHKGLLYITIEQAKKSKFWI